MQKSRPISKEVLVAASFLIMVPLVSHFLFSWMGFTPTDEGFTLANSRRMLDGQVPHRDFIIIRPFLSPLIHLPFVLFGGENTFWLSRLFVWFQLASISWLWVSVVHRMMKFPFSLTARVLVALVCFAATAHTKHITAWNTIDGLFLIAVGLSFAIRNRTPAKLAGYFLLGLAPLCKQSFVFIAPLSILVLGDWRSIKNWVAIVSPALCYFGFLLLTDAVADAYIQLTARTDLLSATLVAYTGKRLVLAVAIGYLSFRLSLGRSSIPDKGKKRIAMSMMFFAPMLGTAVSLWLGILMDTSFLLFGFFLGAFIYFAISGAESAMEIRVSLLVLITAWSASLSGGYNSPALMSGPILVVLAATLFSRYKQISNRSLHRSLCLGSVVILLCFGVGKTRYVYRDQPAGRLTYHLEGVLPGGRHIYTNANTYAFMSDLKRAVELVGSQNKEYAILPNAAAYWVRAPQANRLPAIWPHENYELKEPSLLKRFIESMEARRNTTVFILQKVSAAHLATGFEPLEDSNYHEVLLYVRTHFTKTQVTEYFELYE